MGVSWTKQIRDRAKSDGKAIFAIAVDDRMATKPSFGGGEILCPIEAGKGVAMFMFFMKVWRGESPRAAFDATDWSAFGSEPVKEAS
jgi:hypothetical protein